MGFDKYKVYIKITQSIEIISSKSLNSKEIMLANNSTDNKVTIKTVNNWFFIFE